jgi:hypothetical protein
MSERCARARGARRAARRGCGGFVPKMVARQSEVRHCLSPPSDREPYAPYSMLIRYMCTACAWEASGAVSGKFREISAPAAPLANFSLNFAKLWDTPTEMFLGRGACASLFLFPNPPFSLLFSSFSICTLRARRLAPCGVSPPGLLPVRDPSAVSHHLRRLSPPLLA